MAVASRRMMKVALAHTLAVVLGDLEHDGGNFGAQIGPACRLDGTGDDRAPDQPL